MAEARYRCLSLAKLDVENSFSNTSFSKIPTSPSIYLMDESFQTPHPANLKKRETLELDENSSNNEDFPLFIRKSGSTFSAIKYLNDEFDADEGDFNDDSDGFFLQAPNKSSLKPIHQRSFDAAQVVLQSNSRYVADSLDNDIVKCVTLHAHAPSMLPLQPIPQRQVHTPWVFLQHNHLTRSFSESGNSSSNQLSAFHLYQREEKDMYGVLPEKS